MMPAPKSHRFRSIVCAVDMSRHSATALRYASALAASSGGTVAALFAVDPLLSAAAAYDSKIVERDALRELERFVRSTLGPLVAPSVRCVVATGPARTVVIREARRLRSDVVVIGTNARRGARKLFFGSTAESVLRHSRGAVLVIPPGCRAPHDTWPGSSIVAAVGQDRHRRAEIGAAARMAEHFGAWLSIVPVTSAGAPRPDRATLIIYPLPRQGRLRTFQQGGAAYRFICASRSPVLVIRTARAGRRVTPPVGRAA
jgi:nucleotide-binding universal stress UspA family protein